MNKLLIIFGTTLLVCFLYRILLVFAGKIICKITKSNDKTKKFDILISTALFFIFAVSLITAIDVVAKSYALTDLEYYMCFCIIGLSAILWSYFDWDISSLKNIPRFSEKEPNLIKKIMVFSVVFVFSFIFGYQQSVSILSDRAVDGAVLLTNFTMISTLIAFDRLLNPIYQYFTRNR